MHPPSNGSNWHYLRTYQDSMTCTVNWFPRRRTSAPSFFIRFYHVKSFLKKKATEEKNTNPINWEREIILWQLIHVTCELKSYVVSSQLGLHRFRTSIVLEPRHWVLTKSWTTSESQTQSYSINGFIVSDFTGSMVSAGRRGIDLSLRCYVCGSIPAAKNATLSAEQRKILDEVPECTEPPNRNKLLTSSCGDHCTKILGTGGVPH